MTMFDKLKSKTQPNRPAFGVVGAPAPVQAPPTPAVETFDFAAYGLVPSDQVDADRPGPMPHYDEIERLMAQPDWRPVSDFLNSMPKYADVRLESIAKLGTLSVDEDGWLREWLAAQPDNVTALAIYGDSLVRLAWEIRTSKMPEHVSQQQWEGFFRILRQIPGICNRAAALDPADPAPLTVLLTAAKGLQWSHDEFRALCAEVMRRAPHSYTANQWAMSYWLPRWFGSKELLTDFVETAIAAAPVGSLLTTMRLDMLYNELRPQGAQEREAYYRSAQMNHALDASLHDLAAAHPNNPKRQNLRHWLAYLLYLADRESEALGQFQALGGYCGAAPWTGFKDYRAYFCKARIRAARKWEADGRPLLPRI